MSTANWLLHLRSNLEAWHEFLAWLDAERLVVLNEDPKTWDEEKERQGKKKMLDKLKHSCTMDLKNEAQRAKLYEDSND